MGYGGRGFKPPLSLHQFFLIDIAILSLFMTFSHYYRHIANITSMGVFKSRENRNLNCVHSVRLHKFNVLTLVLLSTLQLDELHMFIT